MSDKHVNKLMIRFCPVLAYAVPGRQSVMHEAWNDRQAMALLWMEDEQVHELLVWLLLPDHQWTGCWHHSNLWCGSPPQDHCLLLHSLHQTEQQQGAALLTFLSPTINALRIS